MPEKKIQQLVGVSTLLSRVISKLGRSPVEGVLAIRMASWVLAVSLLFRFFPIPRLLRMTVPIRKRRRAGTDVETVERELARVLDMVLRLDFFTFTPICWKRAIVLHRFLLLKGIESRIMFGVRKKLDGELDGHAWLERGHRPILESSNPDFTVTYSFP